MAVLQVLVEPEGAARTRIAAGAPGSLFRGGVLGRMDVAALASPGSGLCLDDATLTRAEEAQGRGLARALEDAGLAGALAAVGLAQPPGGERHLVLVQDPTGVAPWELLAARRDGPPLEATGLALIARLCEGPLPAPHREAVHLRLVLACPTPDEPTCAALLADLARAAAQRGIPVLRLGPEPPDRGARTAGPDARAAVEAVADVFVLVGHGRAEPDGLASLLGPAGELHAGTAAHAWSATLRRSWLVLALVCDAGRGRPLEALGPRLVAAGAPACLAPATALPTCTALRVACLVLDEAAAGASLAEVAWAARAAVRQEGEGWFRWHELRLLVASVEGLLRAPAVCSTRLPGWPPPGDLARPLLARALSLARQDGQGALGVDHLVRGYAAATEHDPVVERLARAARAAPPRPVSRLEARKGPAPVDPVPTPRVRTLGERLPAGFSGADLARAITAAWAPGLQAATGIELGPELEQGAPDRSWTAASTEPVTAPPAAAPAVDAPLADAIELLGGPEDGRVLRLAPGDRVGRARDGAAVAPAGCHLLYGDATIEDRGLSHHHLDWVSPGRIHLRGSARQLVGGVIHPVEAGPRELRVGEILRLGGLTWISGVAAARDRRSKQV